jgi:hypothetical protein
MASSVDYGTAGFRECAAQVASFLATTDDVGLHSPLRMRLLGHLQAYCMQRHLDTSSASTVPAVASDEDEETGSSPAVGISLFSASAARQLATHHQLSNWSSYGYPSETTSRRQLLESVTSLRPATSLSLPHQWDSLAVSSYHQLPLQHKPLTVYPIDSVTSQHYYQPWNSSIDWLHSGLGQGQGMSQSATDNVRDTSLLPPATPAARPATIDAQSSSKHQMTVSMRAKRLPLADIN